MDPGFKAITPSETLYKKMNMKFKTISTPKAIKRRSYSIVTDTTTNIAKMEKTA